MRIFATGAALLLVVPVPGIAQDLSTIASSRTYGGERSLSVDIHFALGEVIIRPDETGSLYRAALTYDSYYFRPIDAYDAADRRLTIGLRGRSRRLDDVEIDELLQELDLAVAPRVPLELSLTFGAARGDIELGGLSLKEALIETGASETSVRFTTPNLISCDALTLRAGAARFHVAGVGNSRCQRVMLQAGAGEITLDLNGEWEPGASSEMEINVGLAHLEIRIPSNLGVALEVDRILAGLDARGFERQGDTYYSENFTEAEARTRLRIGAVFGTIDVERTPSE